MKPDELYELMLSGAKLTSYLRRRKNRFVVTLPDGSHINTQYSVILPLLKQRLVIEKRWFGGSAGDYKYEVNSDLNK